MNEANKELQDLGIYKFIIEIPKNYQLISEFGKEIGAYDLLKKKELDTSQLSFDEIALFGSYGYMDKVVFSFCSIAYRYNKMPIKLISWFKSHISGHELKTKQVIKDFTIKVLEDKDRFPFDATILINGINGINIEDDFYWIEQHEFDYFLGTDRFDDYELFIKSYIQIWGLVKSKNQIIEDFIKENYSKELIEITNREIPRYENNIKANIKPYIKEIEPIRLDATQTQIVYLFKCLVKEKIINESLNPKLWHLVSTYFTDKDNKPLNNIHQTKTNLENTKSGKPKNKAEVIEKVVKDTKNTL